MDNKNTPAYPVAPPCYPQDNAPKNTLPPLNPANILPEFPVDYLPPVIRDYVKAVSENLQVYVDMPATYALAVLALCCQQKVRIRATSTWAEELNLYVCVVAEPSEMKSPVFNCMISPVKAYVDEYNKTHAAEIATAIDIRDSLISQKNQLKGKKGKENEIRKLNEEINNMDIPHFMRLMTTDSTNEALIEMMEENEGSVGIMCDEGGIFEVAGGLYSDNQSNINCYLCAYDGQNITVNRKTRNINVPRATMTIGIFCQPKVLADIMSNSSFTDKGLTQRFIYCMPDSMIGRRKFSDRNAAALAETQKAYNELIHDLLEIPNAGREVCLKLSPEAREAFASYYSVIEGRLAKGNEYEDYRDYFGKFAGRTLRLAGLLHMAKYKDVERPVDMETMTNAYVLSEYFAEQTKMVLGYDKYNALAEKLLEKLTEMCRKKKTDILTMRDINKNMRNRMSKEQLAEAIEELEMKHYITHVMPEKNRYNNRSLGSYKVNPAWLARRNITIGQ